MAAGVSRAFFEPLRSIAFGSISGSYAALGTPVDHQIRGFCITNKTEGDMIVSLDNTVTAGQIVVVAGSYKLWDVQSNMNAQFDDKFVISKGSQFYIKQASAPVSGSVYLECLY